MGFRALFIRLGLSVFLAMVCAMGVSLWASDRAEEALRGERVDRLLVAISTGPLQMARMQSRDLATEQLVTLMGASNAPDPLFLTAAIRSGPDGDHELATWAKPGEMQAEPCIERRQVVRDFPDSIYPYRIAVELDRCTGVAGLQRLRGTMVAASITFTGIILLAFGQALAPVLRSLRAAERSLVSTNRGNRGRMPFEPVETLLAAAERAVHVEREAALASVTRNIFHDLKTPMVAFERASRARDWAEFAALRGNLESSLSRLHAMIDALRHTDLELLVRPVVTTLDLDAIVDDVRPLAAQNYVDVTSYHRSIRCHIDLSKVERALVNLIRNAIEAGAKQVELRSHAVGRELILDVLDDGPGVPDTVTSRLFEKGATSGKAGGSGLGLAFVRNVARGHGGEATYERVGGRSRFRLSLPDALVSETQIAATPSRQDCHQNEHEDSWDLIVLLSDPRKSALFVEVAKRSGFERVSTDAAHTSRALSFYVDLNRFDEVAGVVPRAPVAIANDGDDAFKVLARLRRRTYLREGQST